MKRSLLLIPVFIIISCSLFAETRLPKIFADHMVLQRDKACTIWGWDEPGAQVTVTFAGQTATTATTDQGTWTLSLKPMPASTEPNQLSVKGTTSITLEDILIGDIWLCSGQSNMAWRVGACITKEGPVKDMVAKANQPLIRHAEVARHSVPEGPQDDCKSVSWKVCTPGNVPSFTAVGYFFANKIQPETGVPIGLINSSWGGTPAEAWTRREKVATDKRAGDRVAVWDKSIAIYDPEQAQANYTKLLAEWKEKAAKAKELGEKPPRRPRQPRDPRLSAHNPGNLYNGMIAPLTPLSIKGAIWYQGEANAGRAWAYETLIQTMITDWREVFGQGDFPFGIVQLANFRGAKAEPSEDGWAELRASQHAATKALPNVGLACIIDVGAANDIHPKDKITVGNRLGLWALGTVYGKELVHSGPVYKSHEVRGDSIVITFDHLGGNLVTGSHPPFGSFTETDTRQVNLVQIAGEDKQWVWATSMIQDNTLVVRSSTVSKPVAVRYAWSCNPNSANLYNSAGLPAVPFRTDDWPLSTTQK